MKITCQSCQSKYTVSDEKVQGKTVKIKCRKCGATILVNSGGVTTSAPAETTASGGPAEGGVSYLVNVTEGDQRSMTLPEILAAYQSAVVNAETYVWADGMSDWQPLGQVDAIVSALHAQAAAPEVSAIQASPAVGGAGADLAAEQEPRAAARREAARPAPDVFSARQDEGGYANGSAAPAARPAPAPSGGGRSSEENSMLFSLSALTAKAATTPSVAPKATTARDREDSGIIDLKALAAAAAAQSAPSPAANAPAAAAFLPDGGLFPLGAPAAAAPAPAAVVAPSMPPPSKSKAPIFIGIGVVVALGAIVGAFMLGRGTPTPPPAPADTATAQTASAEPTATAAPSAVPSAEPTASASASASAAPSAAPAAHAPVAKGGKPAAGGKPAGGGGKAAAPAPAPAPAGPKKGNCGCSPGDLMCAMKCSAGKK